MHEMSITQSLLGIALAEATRAGAQRIKTIRLKVGAITGVVPDSVAFYLELLARGTMAEGVCLEATIMPATGYCPACKASFPADDLIFVCPQCQGPAQVSGGRELLMESLEVE
jgi:hydrogenase nickel incorporation protein HypA/HybF